MFMASPIFLFQYILLGVVFGFFRWILNEMESNVEQCKLFNNYAYSSLNK